MNLESQLPAAQQFLFQVERHYAGLMRGAPSPPDQEPSLGGRLLYAGELDEDSRALLVAANIAAAASLTASADPAAQRQAMRDGVVDFLVTSLDEALRILKNELRKQETVAVCVGLAPETVEREMLERGVLPDLLRAGSPRRPECTAFLSQGAQPVNPSEPGEDEVLVAWTVAQAGALWLPRLDALAADGLGAGDGVARRWLRLAPRFLGRMAQGMRLLRLGDRAAQEFLARVEQAELGVAVQMRVTRRG